MKKIFFILGIILFTNTHARVSGPGPGWGMEIDHESLGGGGIGKFPSEDLDGSRFKEFLTSKVEGISGLSGMEVPNTNSFFTERPFRIEYSRKLSLPGY